MNLLVFLKLFELMKDFDAFLLLFEFLDDILFVKLNRINCTFRLDESPKPKIHVLCINVVS